MGSVIALDTYRRAREPERGLNAPRYPRPRINDSEIFARDYTTIGGQVFAILKIREILRFHVHSNEEWQYLILCVLDAAYHYQADKSQILREAVQSLKDYVLGEINTKNNQDMTSALLLLDLIEKSQRRKSAAKD